MSNQEEATHSTLEHHHEETPTTEEANVNSVEDFSSTTPIQNEYIHHDDASSEQSENNGVIKGLFGRRAWDDQAYEQRALERMNRGSDFEIDYKRKPTVSRSEALSRKPLEARDSKILHLDGQVGKKGVIEVTSEGKQLMPNSKTIVKSKKKGEEDHKADPSKMAGFYCKVCDKSFRDSNAFLDHCNTKFHLSKMGVSNRAVKATADDVKQKLQAKIAAKKANQK